MNSSTVDRLEYLKDTKDAIKAAIISKGQPVSDSDTFRSYASKIRNINGGGGSDNGAYDAKLTLQGIVDGLPQPNEEEIIEDTIEILSKI